MSKSRIRFEGGGVLRNEAGSAAVGVGRSAAGARGNELRFEANFGQRGVGRRYLDFFRLNGRRRPALFLGVLQVFETALVALFDGRFVRIQVSKNGFVGDTRKRNRDGLTPVAIGGILFAVFFLQVGKRVVGEHAEGFRFDTAGPVQPPLGFG